MCYVAMLSPTKLWHFTIIPTPYFFMADVFYIILLLLLPGKIMIFFRFASFAKGYMLAICHNIL